MVTTTLDAMAAGGIYDHVGGGFARYSTDAHWLVPHFEKMLYDQALLVGAYLRGFLVTGTPRYRRIVEETITYVLRDLRHPDGGFFSAEDADSEGIEGKFYLWSLDGAHRGLRGPVRRHDPRVRRHRRRELPRSAHRLLGQHPGPGRPATRTPPRSSPRRSAGSSTGGRRGSGRGATTRSCSVGTRSSCARSPRPRPRSTGPTGWKPRATTHTSSAMPSGGRMAGCCAPGTRRSGGRHLAVAEDYAALLEAYVTLAEVDDVAWLEDARWCADELFRLFHDEQSGGFFTTGSDAEALIVRPQDFFDNATPSENSLAADGLLRLAALTGDAALEDSPRRLLGQLAELAGRHGWQLRVPAQRLRAGDDRTDRDRARRRRPGPPPRGLRPADPGVDRGAGRARTRRVADTPLLADRTLVDGLPTAYVCERFACRLPVTDRGGPARPDRRRPRPTPTLTRHGTPRIRFGTRRPERDDRTERSGEGGWVSSGRGRWPARRRSPSRTR